MDVEVDLRQVVYALSDALDPVGMNDFYHGKRVGLMAVEVSRYLGTDGTGRDFARMDVAPDVARKADLIFLVDRADALATHYGPDLLRSKAQEGKLDASAVELVGHHLDACWRAASDGHMAIGTL